MNEVDRQQPELVFLKLGGSLITEKNKPRTPRLETMARLAGEIAAAMQTASGLQLIVGHGAGSFGHVSANKYGTRQGVHTPEAWLGFAEVWWDASALNRLVVSALRDTGLPAIAFPPSASVIARNREVASWDLTPLKLALRAGLLPVIFGDVVFDLERGGTILSTEDLFTHLARHLRPGRVLLAGIEPGVWADFPHCTRLITEITPDNFPEVARGLRGSAATDVTGGMASKVEQSLKLVQEIDQEVLIFSGETKGLLQVTLLGQKIGTSIRK